MRQPASILVVSILAILMAAQYYNYLQTKQAIERRQDGLDPTEVENLEARIEKNPDDSEARLELLNHFYVKRIHEFEEGAWDQKYRRHLLWFIEHHPESHIFLERDYPFRAYSDPTALKRAKTLWRKHVELEPENTAMLLNGGVFFSGIRSRVFRNIIKARR